LNHFAYAAVNLRICIRIQPHDGLLKVQNVSCWFCVYIKIQVVFGGYTYWFITCIASLVYPPILRFCVSLLETGTKSYARVCIYI
jgi:hypothetical protein